jgi:hypothetical protein
LAGQVVSTWCICTRFCLFVVLHLTTRAQLISLVPQSLFHQAIPSRGVVSRFSIDPREYDAFQIANYLWSAMEGEVAPAIRAT